MKARMLVLMAVLATGSAGAQEVPREQPVEPTWYGGVFYDGDFFSGSDPTWDRWTTLRALAIREWDGGALGVEALRTRRFGRDDAAVTVDGYVDLWDGAYGNLRLRHTPGAEVLPDWDARGEIFQVLGSGWEISGSYWRMTFALADVDLWGGGLGRYSGDWYLRVRGQMAKLGGEEAASFSVAARRFLGDSRQYVELSGGLGQEAVTLEAGPVVDLRDTAFLQVVAQRFVSEVWGLHLNGGAHTFEGIPTRVHVSGGVVARF